jgi:hypothetical protein
LDFFKNLAIISKELLYKIAGIAALEFGTE